MEIMRKKVRNVRMRKFHTSALTEVLPEGVLSSAITPGLSNINEFLSRDTFNLHKEIPAQVRQPNSGLVTFVRDEKFL